MIQELFEKIDVRKGIGPVVTDFQNSNAPQFKGKSDKEIRDMALAAYFAKKEGTEPDYIKDFLAKGGKIKKLPPGKAAGYHGKPDPGADIKGMLAKNSAKKFKLKGHGKHLDTSTPVHNEATKHNPKHIKQAIGIASDKRYAQGNMTGAVNAMNKLSKDIHKHPQVAAVLKRQNEGKAYGPTGISYSTDGVERMKKKSLKHGSPEGEALKKVIARKEKAFKDLSKKETSEAYRPTGINEMLPVAAAIAGRALAPKVAGAVMKKTGSKTLSRVASGTTKGIANSFRKRETAEAVGQPSDRMKAKNNAYKLKLQRDHEYEMKHGRKKDKRGIGENTSDISYAAGMHFDNPDIKVKKASGGKYHVPMKSYHTKKDAQSFASQNGLKLHSHEKTMGGSRATVSVEATMKTFDEIREAVELGESTNWKGGSKFVSLTRYAAKNGFGLQITQAKPMLGDKVRLKDAYVNMPLKDIPKLIKALQTVLKADPRAQLGDDD